MNKQGKQASINENKQEKQETKTSRKKTSLAGLVFL